MAIPLVYDAQLVIMLPSELKAKLRTEADERKVSLGQVAREYLERGMAVADWEAFPLRYALGEGGTAAPRVITTATYPDSDTATDAAEQIERNRLDAEEDDEGPSLAELAATLGPDDEGDDVDGINSGDELRDRLARLHARGLG